MGLRMNDGHHSYDPAAPLPLLPGHSSGGRLERVLRLGRFAVTAELNPPDSSDPRDVYERALVLSEVCDAINATDASGANCHMSSVGICSLLTRAGYAVIMQISCRDRNRIAIQGDVLGAAAMGVQNILCLTGDGVQAGDQPAAKPVFDFDSTSLLECIRTMRDKGHFLSGRKLTTPPRVFLGAAANPFAPPYEYRAVHIAKKIAAGAQFIQTQYCFDVPLLRKFMDKVREQGLHEKAFFLDRCRTAAFGQDGALDEEQRAGGAYPRGDHRADGKGQGPAGRRQAIGDRFDPGDQGDRWRFRRACDGLSAGRVRERDHPGLRRHAEQTATARGRTRRYFVKGLRI